MSFVVVCALAALVAAVSAQPRTFTIENDRFVRDGQEYLIYSGCIHYSRVHHSYWKDRLTRIRAMGLNAIETYVPWNFHNPSPGVYNFTGGADLAAFLQEAHNQGLLVLLRAGPYMCGEWEFGGFPAFLLAKEPPVTIRTYESGYIAEVDKWWSTLLPVVKPYLYENGGPIVMMQVENEYGSYGNVQTNPLDKQYMQHLVDLARSILGNNVILYTTDGGDTGYMSRGTLPGQVFTVGDFGPGNPEPSFAAQKVFNPKGKSPNMCTEYYTGWLTHWGEGMANTSTANVAKYLEQIINLNGSFSLYMAHGGSNFGFWSGANGNGGTSYQPHITSYDYDSPISEGGEYGYGSDGLNKFEAIKEVLLRHPQPFDQPPPAFPDVSPTAYGTVQFSQSASFLGNLRTLTSKFFSNQDNVKPQEMYNQSYGFTLYTNFLRGTNGSIDVREVRDRAQVFVAGNLLGTIDRTAPAPVSGNLAGRLDVLVENMGRINYGHGMTDPKGIVGTGVFVNGQALTGGWNISTLPLDPNQVAALPWGPISAATPAFYKGSLTVTGDPEDTYIAMAGWTKGYVWVNGFLLGRYWETRGPQHTLYVPKWVLQSGANTVIALELEEPESKFVAQSLDAPIFRTGGDPCDPSGTVTPGADVVGYTLDSSLAASQQWSWISGGKIKLASNTSLCMAVGPRTDPSTGQPAIQVALCSDPRATTFTFRNGEIVTKSGDCIDITSHGTADGSAIETYACNGGNNQVFTFQNGVFTSSEATSKPFVLTGCFRRPGMREESLMAQMDSHKMH